MKIIILSEDQDGAEGSEVVRKVFGEVRAALFACKANTIFRSSDFEYPTDYINGSDPHVEVLTTSDWQDAAEFLREDS